MKNRIANYVVLMLALVVTSAFVQSAAAQRFKAVMVQGGSSLAQVSSGGSSVWALGTNGHPYIFNAGKFVQANSIVVSQIAAGGGDVGRHDAVWARDSAGKVYRGAYNGTSASFSQVTASGFVTLIAVGVGYQGNCHPYEVWILNSSAAIYRYDYCSKTFTPVNGILCSLWVGGGDAWGNDCSGNIFRFNVATGVFDQIPGALDEIAVGPNGVFGISGDSLIWEFQDNIQNFIQLPGTLAHIAAGGNGVWGINSSQQIYRLEPSTATFGRIPGSLVSISVGSGGGVWGIDAAGKGYKFTSP